MGQDAIATRTAGALVDAARTAGELADEARTAGKATDEAVTAGKATDEAVTAAELVDAARTSREAADEAVTAGELAYEAQASGELADEALVRAFETGTLGAEAFRHREHIRVAWVILRQHDDLAEAAGRFRGALRRFAGGLGKPQLFHETLTWAYLVLIREAMHGHVDGSSLAFVARCPDLLDHRGGALSRLYDLEAITRCPVAREVFVLPRRGGSPGQGAP